MNLQIAVGAIHDGTTLLVYAGTPEQVTLWLYEYVVDHWHTRFGHAQSPLPTAYTELLQIEYINEFFAPRTPAEDFDPPIYKIALQTLPLTVRVA